jgi:hypothetical protein
MNGRISGMTPGVRPLPVVGTGLIVAGPVTLYGYSLKNVGGSPATFRIWDNASAASGTIIITLGLDAGEAVALAAGVGILAAQGLYFESGGAIEGSAWVSGV